MDFEFVGLLVLLAIQIGAGAMLFREFEKDGERQAKAIIKAIKETKNI